MFLNFQLNFVYLICKSIHADYGARKETMMEARVGKKVGTRARTRARARAVGKWWKVQGQK